jgi:ribonuclease BN (tRNA processing enzyme)
MPSQLVVLGSCGAWPEPRRACSGYVLEHDGFRIVMDLGYGTLGRLLDVVDSRVGAGIDAVIITHKHPDHMLDLHGLFRARTFGDPEAGSLPLYAPDGVVQRLRDVEDFDRETILEVFRWRVLPSEDPYELGPWSLHSWSLPHFVPDVGVRLVTDGLIVAYTGDTGPDPCLVDLARAADLFIAEATERRQRRGAPPADRAPAMHLTAREAGEAAQAAGARRLLLTHFWPGKDRESARMEAIEVFDGEVLLADEGLRIGL